MAHSPLTTSDKIHDTPSAHGATMWRNVLQYLSLRVKKQSFATWLKPTRGQLRIDENGASILEIVAPNRFVADWLRDNYSTLIEEAITETSGKKVALDFLAAEKGDEILQTEITFTSPRVVLTTDSIVASSTNGDLPHLANTSRERSGYSSQGFAHARSGREFDTRQTLNDRYRFGNLVVGNFNQMGHAACLAVAEKPGQTTYNPLFIYGGVGLGKTHLLQAVGHAALGVNPNLKVLYASSETFTSDFISSLSNSTIAEFTRRYRTLDILLVDDIQFFGGKESTQEQFFHTFNALYNAGKQIVLTADRLPQEIKGLEARLLSRFGSGLITDIQSPDLEGRIAILKKKMSEFGLAIEEEVLFFVASRVVSNVRELEGALTRLYARASLAKISEISLAFAQNALEDILGSFRRSVTVESIQSKVAEEFEVPSSSMRAKKRTAQVALARQVAMYLTRTLTPRSLQQIGQDFGGRDHSTVIHACSLVQQKAEKDTAFRGKIDALARSLR